MPKGALLHAHLDATVNARVLLKFALERPEIHIALPHALTSANIETTIPQFQPLTTASSVSSLTSADYTPGQWVPIVQARESFPETFGGPEGFDKWIVGALMINPSEAYEQYNTTNKVTMSTHLYQPSMYLSTLRFRSGENSKALSKSPLYV